MLDLIRKGYTNLAALSPPSGGGGGGGGLPPAATAQLDFVNGFYYAGGATRAVTDILGGGFDSSAISGSGMYVNFSNSNRPTPTGSLLSDIIAQQAAGMTLLFEVTTASSLGGCLFYAGNNANFNSASTWNQTYIDGDVDDDNSVSITASISGAGDHKIATTFNRSLGGGNYEYAWCNDGNSAVTQTVGYAAAALTAAQIGWDGAADGRQLFQTYIKSITLYPAIASASLPALTT
jgi:hypothetical protein